MPDLFDPLRNLDDLPVHPLPADDVRRKGDRMRRRRQAMQALGAAAIVAVVASGTALGLSTLDDLNKPDGTPVTAPEGGWRTEIPTHYPLDRGWPMVQPPEESQLGPSQKFAPLSEEGVEPCGVSAYPSAAPIDSVGTEWNAPEDQRARELTLYPDSATASTVIDRMVDAWQACPTEEQTAPPFERNYVVTRSSLGDESWTIAKGTSGALGLEIFNVARVGNAVLINWVSNHGALDTSAPLIAEQDAQVGQLVADLCIFALVPCEPVVPDDVEPKIPPLPETTLLTTEQLVDATGLNGWELLGQREDPTLDCQSGWLRNLEGAEKGGYREWRRDGSEAATAVLEFGDRATALTAYAEVRGWLAACDDRLPGTRALSPVSGTTETRIADSDVVTRPFFASMPDGGQRLDQQGAALVGNRIVFLAFSPDRGTGIEEEALSTSWLAAMASAIEVAAPAEPAGVDIPADFPMLTGWPSDDQAETAELGLEGPSRALEPLAITRCDETFEPPPYVDQLHSRWSNVEDYRWRQLTTYADAAAAVAAVQALVDFYGACTSTTSPDVAGNVSHYEVRPTKVGGQSFGLVHYYTYDGAPTIGLEVHHVIRLGRAVLIVTGYNEGSVADSDGQLAGQADEAATLIAAMCLFTEAGC